MVRKTRQKIFHSVESFPWHVKSGRNFSMAWKTRQKNFHTVEKPAGRPFSAR